MAFAMVSANAQQKEAVLQKAEVPGVAFDIILAMPKPQGVTFDLSESPDALLVNLIGGELALALDDAEKMFADPLAPLTWRALTAGHGYLLRSTSSPQANSPLRVGRISATCRGRLRLWVLVVRK
jgi:hypothetical protein